MRKKKAERTEKVRKTLEKQKIIFVFSFSICLIVVFLGYIEVTQLLSAKYSEKILTPEVSPTIKLSPTLTPLTKMTLPIIMYHYVEHVKDPNDTTRIKLDTSPALLESQFKMLNDNHYNTYFVKEIPDILKQKITLTSNSIILTFDDGYEDFYTDAFPILKKYKFKSTIYIVSGFIDRDGYLSKSQLDEIAKSGLVEIGDHTVTHPDLKHIPLLQVKKQILESKKIIEDMFNIKIETFAYPGGSYNDDVVNAVHEAGYTVAVTTKPGITIYRDQLLTVHRIRPGFLNIISVQNFFKNFKLQ